jgi:hypothetical protein
MLNEQHLRTFARIMQLHCALPALLPHTQFLNQPQQESFFARPDAYVHSKAQPMHARPGAADGMQRTTDTHQDLLAAARKSLHLSESARKALKFWARSQDCLAV